MKITQITDFKRGSHINNSYQREIWEAHWDKNSIGKLTNQLFINPTYWRLKELINKKQKILEAGCGLGQWVLNLSEEGYKITGVDIAKTTINKVKKAWPKLNLLVANVERLPFKDKSFDVYLSFGVIEHFEKGPEQVLREAFRVTKPGGLLYLTVPYLNLPRFLKYRFSSKKKGEFYQYLYTKNEIISLIKVAGFKVDRVGYYDFITAIKKDLPFFNFFMHLISSARINSKSNFINQTSVPKGKSRQKKYKIVFLLQRLLYLLDSYIILIEARKEK